MRSVFFFPQSLLESTVFETQQAGRWHALASSRSSCFNFSSLMGWGLSWLELAMQGKKAGGMDHHGGRFR